MQYGTNGQSRKLHAADMVSAISTALQQNPGAVVSVSIDGQTVTYNRKQAMDELKYWEDVYSEEDGGRPRARTITLSSF